jgi:L-ascorbate metabolism protein UlaG (beta-lactamase superfamily)
MEIEYKGGNTVVISTKGANLVIDPKASIVGLKDMSTKDAIELATEARFALNNDMAKLNIEGPGEYGVAGFDIKGVAAQRHLDTEGQPLASTMYRVEALDVRIAVIGNVYEKISETQLEDIGIVDILILPVGGSGYTLDATGASTIVRQVEPKLVIPVHYADDGLKYEVPQDTFETFAKELGAPVEEVAKYKLKSAGQLPATLTTLKLARS